MTERLNYYYYCYLWFGGFHRQQLAKKRNKERTDFLKYLPLFWLTEGIAGVRVCVCVCVCVLSSNAMTGFLGWLSSKESAGNAGDTGSVSGTGRFPWKGK